MITEIENFKLIEFLNQPRELIDAYLVALKYLKPKDTNNEVFHLSLRNVEDIKKAVHSGNDRELIEMVSIVQKEEPEFVAKVIDFFGLRNWKKKKDSKKILDLTIIDFFSLVNSIKKQLEVIVKAEQNLAPAVSNPKWDIVKGSERMAVYGVYNALDMLTGRKPHLYSTYMDMSFSELFTVLHKWNKEADISAEMDKIKLK